jgi:hypothetical protein
VNAVDLENSTSEGAAMPEPSKFVIACYVAGVCAALLAIGGVAHASQLQPAQHAGPTVTQCADFKGDAYGVCAAYVIDDTDVLWKYYEVGADPVKAYAAQQDLATRYQGEALQALRDRVAGWNAPYEHTAAPPAIAVSRIKMNARCGTAVALTTESWVVHDNIDHFFYSEELDPHTVLLRRLPGERFSLGKRKLRAWAVYKIYDQQRPDLEPNCT